MLASYSSINWLPWQQWVIYLQIFDFNPIWHKGEDMMAL